MPDRTPPALAVVGDRLLTGLRDEGRRSAALFLEAHGADLGRRSTLDLDAMLETC